MLPGLFAILKSWSRLPAAVAASPTAAIAAVPASASAPSSSATTTAEAATAAPASPTAPAFSRRPGFVDNNVAAHEIVAVQSLDGTLGFLVAIDLDKSKPTWLPRETVADQGDIRRG